MRLKKTSVPGRALTEVELELMNVVWLLGACTIKDVQKGLSSERNLAYTSVATIMKILEQKGFLQSQKSDRVHEYHASVSKADYESTSLRRLANDLFRGDPSSMVMRLLSDGELSQQELNAIRKIINESKIK